MSVEMIVIGIVLIVLLVARRAAIGRMIAANGQASEEGLLADAEAARPGVIVAEILIFVLIVYAVGRAEFISPLFRFAAAAVVMVVGLLLLVPTAASTRPLPWLRWASTLLGSGGNVRETSASEPAGAASDPFDERVLLDRMLRFRETEIEEVMVPRIDMVAIEKQANVRTLLDLVEEHRHSRYPVYDTDIDRVVEYVNVFDLLKLPPGTHSFAGLVRDALVVPETKHCDDLLAKMAATGKEFAVVVDEYGGTAGLVTREDLLEELVGEIWDEHERESVVIRRVGRSAYVAQAVASVDDVRAAVGIVLPDGDYETLAGFLLDQFGRIPVRGDTVRFDSATFEVLVANRRRIESVQISLDRSGGRA